MSLDQYMEQAVNWIRSAKLTKLLKTLIKLYSMQCQNQENMIWYNDNFFRHSVENGIRHNDRKNY